MSKGFTNLELMSRIDALRTEPYQQTKLMILFNIMLEVREINSKGKLHVSGEDKMSTCPKCKTEVKQIQSNAWECKCFLWVLEKRLRRYDIKG